jgi:hypothetical protein
MYTYRFFKTCQQSFNFSNQRLNLFGALKEEVLLVQHINLIGPIIFLISCELIYDIQQEAIWLYKWQGP